MFKTITILFLLLTNVYAKNSIQNLCETKKDTFIFVSQECINYSYEEGEDENNLIVILHGSWKNGSDVLKKYETLAENIVFNTDVSTITIAMPGYSKSSKKHFSLLDNKEYKYLVYTKEYVHLLKNILLTLKTKYKKTSLTLLAHSAGASLGTTLYAYDPSVINTMISLAGNYVLPLKYKNKKLFAAKAYIKNIHTTNNLVLVSGDKDKISPPKLSQDFYTLLKKQNLKVKLLEVKNANHFELENSEEVMQVLINSLE